MTINSNNGFIKVRSEVISINDSSLAIKDSSKLSAGLVNSLDIPFKRYNTFEIRQRYPHLNRIKFSWVKELDVIILIDTNHTLITQPFIP